MLLLIRILLLLLLCIVIPTIAIPSFIVDSGKVRCVSLEAPIDTVLKIQYEAPDLILDKTDENYGPTYLSVNVSPSRRIIDFENHPSTISKRLNPTSELLNEKTGVVKHPMEVDGEAKICIRSSMASSLNPMRFGLLVTRDDSELLSQKDPALDEDGVDSQLSHMELEMKRISMAMKSIMSDAEFSKERDAIFHKQTASMHSATVFWPIVQTCVLLMTGFTQASHITNFFKSRRII